MVWDTSTTLWVDPPCDHHCLGTSKLVFYRKLHVIDVGVIMLRSFGVIMLRTFSIIMLRTFSIIMLRTFSMTMLRTFIIMMLRTFSIIMLRTFIIILEMGPHFSNVPPFLALYVFSGFTVHCWILDSGTPAPWLLRSRQPTAECT